MLTIKIPWAELQTSIHGGCVCFFKDEAFVKSVAWFIPNNGFVYYEIDPPVARADFVAFMESYILPRYAKFGNMPLVPVTDIHT